MPPSPSIIGELGLSGLIWPCAYTVFPETKGISDCIGLIGKFAIVMSGKCYSVAVKTEGLKSNYPV